MINKKKVSSRDQEGRLLRILAALDQAYPDAQCALDHRNPLELLVATILSAQCTDERVNIVTRNLFQKCTRVEDYINLSQDELEKEIHSTGFYRNKAKSIQGACRLIVKEFDGRVPSTMEELLRLPGVARKTANVVLGVAYRKAEGIVVDTHVFRVSCRLDLSHAPTPEKVEAELMKLIPKDRWITFSHQIIHHGRQVCKARKPLCHVCPVEKICQSTDKVTSVLPSGS